jgi:stringent starvation protein B
MSPQQPLPPKKEVAHALLETASVNVHLDPRCPNVVVPPAYRKQPQLVLQVGLNMAVPIPDLRIDDEGMSCTLTFKRTPFFCVVPWASVFAMIGDDGRGMVWPDDVPAEVAQQAQGRVGDGTATKDTAKASSARDSKSDPSKPKRPRKRPALTAVPDEEEETVERSLEAEPLPSPPVAARRVPAVAPPMPEARASEENSGGVGGTAVPRRRRELPPYLRVVK